MSILSAVLGGANFVLLSKGKSTEPANANNTGSGNATPSASQAAKAVSPTDKSSNPTQGVTVVPVPATMTQPVGAAARLATDSDGTYAQEPATTPAPAPVLPTVVPSGTTTPGPSASVPPAPPSEPLNPSSSPASQPKASEPPASTGTFSPAAPNNQAPSGPKAAAAPPSSPAMQSPVASGAAASTDRVGKAGVATDQDLRAAAAASAAAVLASLVATADTGKSADKSDGKPRTTVDLLDQNQKSFAKLMSESDKKSDTKAKTAASSEKPDDTRSSDSKRVENAYAAYAAYDADEPKAKAA